jgi:hypothetical protein
MNIARSFTDFLISSGFGTAFGVDVFIGGVPLEAPERSFWVTTGGGSPESRNSSGEVVKNYVLNIYYRSLSTSDVYDTLQNLEILLNSANCIELEDFDTMKIEAILFPTDQDIDSQERTVGTIQLTIQTYYKE